MEAVYQNGHYIIFLRPEEFSKDMIKTGLEADLEVGEEGKKHRRKLELCVDFENSSDFLNLTTFPVKTKWEEVSKVRVAFNEKGLAHFMSQVSVIQKYEKGTIVVQKVSRDVMEIRQKKY